MALKVNGYKTALIPRGFNDFQTPSSLSHFHLENGGHWLLSAYYCNNPCVGVQHGRDYRREGQLASGRRKKSSCLAWPPLFHPPTHTQTYSAVSSQLLSLCTVNYVYVQCDVMPNLVSALNIKITERCHIYSQNVMLQHVSDLRQDIFR